MTDDVAPVEAIIARCAAGAASPAMALMDLLLAGADVAAISRAVDDACRRAAAAERTSLVERERLQEMSALLRRTGSGCVRIAAMLRGGMDPSAAASTGDEAIARCRALFDRFAAESEEGSVALYSLGSAELLDRATEELVEVLARWGVLGAERRVLQVGCGIGRVERRLAPLVREAVGIDISPTMIAAARRRMADVPNARFLECSGRDLAPFGDGAFDLVYAVDTFPYLHQAGASLVETHVRESRRVLRAHGDLVILNFSYRGDADADRRDVERLAAAHGLDIVIDGSTPFALWDGLAFHLRRDD